MAQVSAMFQGLTSRAAQQKQNYVQGSVQDYTKQLQGFGQDYKGAMDWADQYQKQNQGMWNNLAFARQAQEARDKYFGGQKYDYSKGNYDDWKRLQDQRYYVGWNRNKGYGGKYAGYAPQAEAKMLRDYQQAVAGDRATRFGANLPNYIEGETSGLRQALGEKMNASRKNLLAEMNRRGILRSGQRGMGEVDLASQFAGQYEQGRADIYKQAQEKAQQLFTDPTLKGLGYDARALDVQNQLQRMKDQESAARSQLFGGAMGLIGSGVGGYYGSKTSTPKNGLTSAPTGAPSGGTYATGDW